VSVRFIFSTRNVIVKVKGITQHRHVIGQKGFIILQADKSWAEEDKKGFRKPIKNYLDIVQDKKEGDQLLFVARNKKNKTNFCLSICRSPS